MTNEELNAVFDQQAMSYDEQQAKFAPIREALHFLLVPMLSDLPQKAEVLCVGVGTGTELVYLAQRFPDCRLTAVEPSEKMLTACRQKAENAGVAGRCTFHQGYVESLPCLEKYDAATCFMVSQFFLDQAARSAFFLEIAQRLKPDALLASADFSADVGSKAYEVLLAAWLHMLFAANMSPEAVARTQAAWAKDVAILPPATVALIIEAGGFESPVVEFYQAGLVHAWVGKRSGSLKPLASCA